MTGVAKAIGSSVQSIFSPQKPEKVDIPPPPPVPTVTDAEQQALLESERVKKRRGRASAILTGEDGLSGALGPVNKTTAGSGTKALLGGVG